MTRRATHRNKSGIKLYAARDSGSRFLDIKAYKSAHKKSLRLKTGTHLPNMDTSAERVSE